MNHRFFLWLRDAAACLLAAFLLIGLAGAVGIIATKHLGGLTLARCVGFVFEAALLVLLLRVALRRAAPRSHRSFVIAVIVAAAFVRCALVLVFRDYQQLADRLFFQEFSERAADGSVESLRSMALIHDYYVWAGRYWPQNAWLVRWFGIGHVLAAQFWNVLCGVVILALTARAARIAAGRKVARLALVWSVAFPTGAWSSLDFTYQFQGTVAVLAGMVIFARWLSPRARLTPAALFPGLLALLACIVVLNLQRGLDMIVLMTGIIATALALVFGQTRRTWLVLAAVVVLITGFRFALDEPLNRKFREAGRDNYYSHAIAQMGIGFSPFARGEFSEYYVHLDRETPQTAKNDELIRLLLGQVRATPLDFFGTQPLIKSVKYLQAGAASGVEQSLELGGSPHAAEFFRGTRVLYTFALLGFALLGALRARALLAHRPALTHLIVNMLAACIIYAWLNQVSPRYVFYFFPLLAIIASLPALRPRGSAPARHPLTALIPAASFVLLYAALAGGILLLARGLPATKAISDLRAWTATHSGNLTEHHRNPACDSLVRNFDLRAAKAGDSFSIELTAPVPADARLVEFLAWFPELRGASRDAVIELSAVQPDTRSVIAAIPLSVIHNGKRHRTALPVGTKDVSVRCFGTLAADTPPLREAFGIGFAGFREITPP